MRILLDECLPLDFRHSFPGHETHTVQGAGLKGKKNGELLRAAVRCMLRCLSDGRPGNTSATVICERDAFHHSDSSTNEPIARPVATRTCNSESVGIDPTPPDCSNSVIGLIAAPSIKLAASGMSNQGFSVTRRQFFLSGKLSTELAISLRSIVVRVNVLFDQAPHGGKELTSDQRSLFQRYQNGRGASMQPAASLLTCT